jgi:hypothetical protein
VVPRPLPYPAHSGNSGVPSSPDFPEIERGILAFWKKDDTFCASVEQREGCEEWVFYDGPPFANGLRTTATSSPGNRHPAATTGLAAFRIISLSVARYDQSHGDTIPQEEVVQ